jgi:hypothetical protein
MHRMRFPLSSVLSGALLLACGGGTTLGNGGGGAGGSAAGGTSSSACPNQPPPSGSSCSSGGSSTGFAIADCSWGDDPRPGCRVGAACSNGAWSVTQPPADCAATVPLPAACPQTPPAAAAGCTDPTLACWYGDGTICNCSACQGGTEYPICRTIDPPQWACKTPDAACPNPLPQAGAKCDAPDTLSCGPSCELPIRCQDGAWQYGREMCPICAAPSTPIATPTGERAISELAPGDLVYSVDETGVVVVPILRVGSTPVVNHRVVRVELSGGAVLEISAGHPTADGRTFADLLGGGQLDADHSVVAAEMVPYPYSRTYDILPSTRSGRYFAGGALIGSTLAYAATVSSRSSARVRH